MTDRKCSINNHISNYLGFYLNECSPGYGVLINGGWGVGKTYYIKKYLLDSELVKASLKSHPFLRDNTGSFKKIIDSCKKKMKMASYEPNDDFSRMNLEDSEDIKKRYIYVSLYGLKSTEDINKAIASQLLFSGNENFSKLANGVFDSLKGFVNFGSDIGLSDLSFLSGNVFLYVFDDLERYSGDVNEALGFINSLVEHKGAKVLVLANENEINDEKVYRLTKEKLIGKSFELQPDFDSAYFVVLESMKEHSVWSFLNQNYQAVRAIFDSSEKKNLRAFKQAIMEFKGFYSELVAGGLEDHGVAKNHLIAYLIMAFEYQIGELEKVDIEKRKNPLLHSVRSMKSDYEFDTFDKMELRHSGVDFKDNVFSMEFILQVLDKSWLDTELLEKELSAPPFKEKAGDEEEWRVLWAWDSYSEDEFNKALDCFENKLNYQEYDDLAVIIHSVGIKLSLVEAGLINIESEKVLEGFYSYVDMFFSKLNAYEYFDDKSVIAFYQTHVLDVYQESAYGLGFKKLDDDRLKSFCNYLDDALKKAIVSTFDKRAEVLLNVLSKDASEFYRQLNGSGEDAAANNRIPIIMHFDVNKLCEILVGLENDKMSIALGALASRFRNRDKDLRSMELETMREIKSILLNYAKKKGEYKRKVVEKKISQRLSINLDS
ncbi:P-loop NTPase fold protein [Halomonas sp. HMF6819]|uniref:P-loop NTPase fold protein n=1 Tax=Halomonas sp. HMF6819 TaxID=3373085 RepID=UPI0037AF904A